MLKNGTHKIRLVADGKNTVVESDNNNNGYSRSIEIVEAPALASGSWEVSEICDPADELFMTGLAENLEFAASSPAGADIAAAAIDQIAECMSWAVPDAGQGAAALFENDGNYDKQKLELGIC